MIIYTTERKAKTVPLHTLKAGDVFYMGNPDVCSMVLRDDGHEYFPYSNEIYFVYLDSGIIGFAHCEHKVTLAEAHLVVEV